MRGRALLLSYSPAGVCSGELKVIYKLFISLAESAFKLFALFMFEFMQSLLN